MYGVRATCYLAGLSAEYKGPDEKVAPTNKTSITTLRNNGQTLVIAVLHDLTDLLCSFRFDNNGTFAMVLVHPVVVKRLQFIGTRRTVDG